MIKGLQTRLDITRGMGYRMITLKLILESLIRSWSATVILNIL